jgi:hypothetical protein
VTVAVAMVAPTISVARAQGRWQCGVDDGMRLRLHWLVSLRFAWPTGIGIG